MASQAFGCQGDSCGGDDVAGRAHGCTLPSCCSRVEDMAPTWKPAVSARFLELEIETITMEHFMLWMGEPVEAPLDVASISVVASEGLRQRVRNTHTYLDEPCAPGVCLFMAALGIILVASRSRRWFSSGLGTIEVRLAAEDHGGAGGASNA